MNPNTKKFMKLTLITILSLILGGTILIGVADEIIQGSVTVDPPTEIENIILSDGTSPITSVDPDATTVYYLNFTVNRPAGMRGGSGRSQIPRLLSKPTRTVRPVTMSSAIKMGSPLG